MTRPIIFDTSFYIRSLRNRDDSVLSKLSSQSARIYLSSVVLEELYVGASDSKSIRALSDLEASFARVNRLIVPNRSDWTSTGLLLNKIGRKYGYERVGKQRLTNDTLLVMSAARWDCSVLTSNARDFGLIREFRQFEYEII